MWLAIVAMTSPPTHGERGMKIGHPETGWFNSKEQVNSGWLLKLGCAWNKHLQSILYPVQISLFVDQRINRKHASYIMNICIIIITVLFATTAPSPNINPNSGTGHQNFIQWDHESLVVQALQKQNLAVIAMNTQLGLLFILVNDQFGLKQVTQGKPRTRTPCLSQIY